MTDRSDVPPLPEPWRPGVTGDRAPAAPAGCAPRPLWIGCGGLLVVFGMLALLFAWKADDFVRWWVTQAETMVVAGLPPEISATERERLTKAFAGLREALISGTGDPSALAGLQRDLGAAVRGAQDQTLDRATVLRLIETMEAIAAARPAPARREATA